MNSYNKILALIFVCLLLGGTPAWAAGSPLTTQRSVQDIRTRYQQLHVEHQGALFAQQPQLSAPHAPGALSPGALQSALNAARFMRYLAGLPDELILTQDYNDLSQHGAVLLANVGQLDHTPDTPEGMDPSFYERGYQSTSSSNLFYANWVEPDILNLAIEAFMRDDAGGAPGGSGNLLELGHRRWLLSPRMRSTGFGLATPEAGGCYVVMQVYDKSGPVVDYDQILWPAAGYFPADYLSVDIPWSISPNPDKYDLDACQPVIELTELNSGARFVFDTPTGQPGQQYFHINTGRYGSGPCYIFRPDLSQYPDLTAGYLQNQRWQVRVTGLVPRTDGVASTLEYQVTLMSLAPIAPADVELSPREASLSPGDQLQLTAQVVPQWADDLTLLWSSSNPEVAGVDESGLVTAYKKGRVTLTATSVNGRSDSLALTVS